MNLEQALAAPPVTDDDVARAEAEATEAAELLAVLEQRAIEDPKPPKPSEVVEQRELASFAARRAERTRQQADDAKAAKRLIELDQLGQDIQALAAAASTPHKGIVKAAADLQAAAATFTQLCSEHDSAVRDFIDRARALGLEPAAPSGAARYLRARRAGGPPVQWQPRHHQRRRERARHPEPRR